MSEPQTAIQNLIKLEGGYVEPPQVEQPTKYGITQSDWSLSLSMGLGVPALVRDITQAQAEEYILKEWLNKAPFQAIDDQGLCDYVFQTCFLSGMEDGIKLLQTALNAEPGTRLAVDGILGKETLSEMNTPPSGYTLSEMRVLTARHYLSIVQASPAKAVYLAGWMNRALNG